jgi:hypothetical protein
MKTLLMIALCFIFTSVSSVPPSIAYECADASECDVELQRCLDHPREYLYAQGIGRRAFDGPLCECWSHAYRCYADCSNKFPADFTKRCTAQCPLPAGARVGGACAPKLNSNVGGLLPAVSAAQGLAPAPVALAAFAALCACAAALLT